MVPEPEGGVKDCPSASIFRVQCRRMSGPTPSDAREPRRAQSLSVVVPAYNEEQVLEEFHARLAGVLASLPLRSEIVYVNDGSSDGTIASIRRLRARDPRVAIVDLSRNFGKEIALTAGLDHARGDVVVIIDADLQDP